MIKRRTIKRFQRTFAVLGLLTVLSSFIVVPAHASELEADTSSNLAKFKNFGYAYTSSSSSSVKTRSISLPFVNKAVTSADITFEDNNLKVSPQIQVGANGHLFSSVTDIYFSFYPYTTSDNSLYYYGQPYSASSWKGNYVNSEGVWGSLNSVDLTTFKPVTDNKYHNGVSLVASYVGSEGLPITDLRLGTAALSGTTFEPTLNGWGFRDTDPTHKILYYVTSLRVITSDTTADSEAIKNISAEIGAMSDILAAKLGEIAQIVQLIYENTGDIEATLNTCKGYFQSMLTALNSIDGTVTDIYSLLDAQLAMLISAINTANNDITGAIEQQTEDMKEYFDNVFGSAVNDNLTGETENIQSGMDNVDNAEQGYISTATDRFDGIVGSFTGFDGSVASGVSLISTLFERVWGSFGQYIVVYTFPLSLGLVLLLIGRVSRASSRSARSSGKSKGGDSE